MMILLDHLMLLLDHLMLLLLLHQFISAHLALFLIRDQITLSPSFSPSFIQGQLSSPVSYQCFYDRKL